MLIDWRLKTGDRQRALLLRPCLPRSHIPPGGFRPVRSRRLSPLRHCARRRRGRRRRHRGRVGRSRAARGDRSRARWRPVLEAALVGDAVPLVVTDRDPRACERRRKARPGVAWVLEGQRPSISRATAPVGPAATLAPHTTQRRRRRRSWARAAKRTSRRDGPLTAARAAIGRLG